MGEYDTRKMLLGFEFDQENKTMWLEEAKREKLLSMLKGWIQAATRGQSGIAFTEFRTVMAKMQTCLHVHTSRVSTPITVKSNTQK